MNAIFDALLSGTAQLMGIKDAAATTNSATHTRASGAAGLATKALAKDASTPSSTSTPTSGATSTSSTDPSTATDPATDAANRFLTLLVTQLQNQDPLNPMDNAQITTQLAQINTVSGINKLNDTVAALAASIGAGQYLQAVSIVGHDVVVPGNDATLANGQSGGGITLPSDADDVTVAISDGTGKVVRTLDLGKQAAGTQFFNWDGKDDAGNALADGQYTFAIAATGGGKPITATALALVRVDGVIPGSSGTSLQLANGSTIDLSQIQQIH
jgi:flagellar basal-body rod modification protein FlgD